MGTTKKKTAKKSDTPKDLLSINDNATLEKDTAVNYGGEKEQQLTEQIALLRALCDELKHANAGLRGENTKLRNRNAKCEKEIVELRQKLTQSFAVRDEMLDEINKLTRLAGRPWWKVLLGLGKDN